MIFLALIVQDELSIANKFYTEKPLFAIRQGSLSKTLSYCLNQHHRLISSRVSAIAKSKFIIIYEEK